MKRLTPLTFINALAILLTVTLAALILIHARNGRFSRECTIQGTVVNASPKVSEEDLTRLQNAVLTKSESEFQQILEQTVSGKLGAPVRNATVTATSRIMTRTVTTDDKGTFRLSGLPDGQYEISVGSKAGAHLRVEQTITARPKVISVSRADAVADVTLPVYTELVSIKGHIADPQGRPIAGAKVYGVSYPQPESAEATPPTLVAVSGADGSYELGGFVPLSIYRIAGYLAGGDPTESGQCPFYVRVRADADGFEQNQVPKVPIATQELIGSARRLLKILNEAETRFRGKPGVLEPDTIPLPSSDGQTITGVDVLLDKPGGGAG